MGCLPEQLCSKWHEAGSMGSTCSEHTFFLSSNGLSLSLKRQTGKVAQSFLSKLIKKPEKTNLRQTKITFLSIFFQTDWKNYPSIIGKD